MKSKYTVVVAETDRASRTALLARIAETLPDVEVVVIDSVPANGEDIIGLPVLPDDIFTTRVCDSETTPVLHRNRPLHPGANIRGFKRR